MAPAFLDPETSFVILVAMTKIVALEAILGGPFNRLSMQQEPNRWIIHLWVPACQKEMNASLTLINHMAQSPKQRVPFPESRQIQFPQTISCKQSAGITISHLKRARFALLGRPLGNPVFQQRGNITLQCIRSCRRDPVFARFQQPATAPPDFLAGVLAHAISQNAFKTTFQRNA